MFRSILVAKSSYQLWITTVLCPSRLKRLRYKVTGCILSWSIFLLILFTRVFIPQRPMDGLVWVLVALCIFIYCCFSVLFSLKQNPPGDRECREESSGVKMKNRAFNIILVHLLCFLVNYLPLFVLFLFIGDRVIYNTFHLFESLGIVCGLIHPILYLHRAGTFCWVREKISSIYLFFSRWLLTSWVFSYYRVITGKANLSHLLFIFLPLSLFYCI